MAWIYLAEAEHCPWPWRHGLEQSPIVKTTHTLKVSCSHSCTAAISRHLASGMTSNLSNEIICLWCRISFLAGFHARILAVQAMERAWTASEADLYLNSSASFASADLDSFSWKTYQLSLFGGLTDFSWNSMRSGMMRDGRLFQPQKWEPPTSGSGSGFLPTPTATPYGSNQSLSPGAAVRVSLDAMARKNLIPTPRAHETGDYQRDQGQKGKERPTLTGTARGWKIPTPMAIDGAKGGPNQNHHGKPSITALAMKLPTPAARDGKDGLTPSQHGQHSPSVGVAVAAAGHPGYLNPRFVEVMMGWPIGWTALESWATEWFRRRRGKRS